MHCEGWSARRRVDVGPERFFGAIYRIGLSERGLGRVGFAGRAWSTDVLGGLMVHSRQALNS
ncbi:MAG: hypothetical protein ACI8PT_000966 [Gammaproteobacteria bacterium]|jgi:hypothetical protein